MGSLDLRADARQVQALSPRLQQAVRLLQLSSLDYARAVHEALDRNPFLEADEAAGSAAVASAAAAPAHDASHGDGTALHAVAGHTEHDAAADLRARDDAAPERASLSAHEPGSDDIGAGSDSDREIWQGGDGALTRLPRADADELGALDRMPAPATLAQHLHGQLIAESLPPRRRLLAHVVVESLDDDGYLRTTLAELAEIAARTCDFEPPPSLEEMESALAAVQALEPAGVAARDVAECLRLQLPGITDEVLRERARRIIDNHLSLLAARDVPALARALGCTPADAGQACERIRRFDPKPGWRHGAEAVPYVVPDVIVQKVRGAWTVKLNPAVVPRVRLNRLYADLLQRARRRAPARSGEAPAEVNAELSSQLQDARWTVRNVEQRFGTILAVAEAIVRRQRLFFDIGPMAMRPLCLNEIAEELGMHESTVSRVTNNKYLLSPLGVFELKHFFSRAMATASGGTCTGTAIRGVIQDMVAHEAADAPLSDVEIARLLGRQGLRLARRTVTKYRQMLKIEAVERRRQRALMVPFS
ncbi:MAG: RNA polymerase factor sigma-54 [Rubrivivax sp.]